MIRLKDYVSKIDETLLLTKSNIEKSILMYLDKKQQIKLK